MIMMMFFKAAMMKWCEWNLARDMSVVPSTATPHTVPTSIAENTAILGEMKYSLVSGMEASHGENIPSAWDPGPLVHHQLPQAMFARHQIFAL